MGDRMKRLIKLSIILLSVFLISGCIEGEEQNQRIQEEKHEIVDDNNISKETTYYFSYKGQEFKIITFFEEVLEYAKTVGENPELDKKVTYTEHVLEPFIEQLSIKDIPLDDMLRPSWDIEQLVKKTNELIEHQGQINKWIEEAIIKSAELLPGEDTNIYIFPVNPEEWHLINTGGGINGMAFSESDFFLMIDPSATEQTIKYSVAHEYHHTVNYLHDGIPIDSNILDLVVMEGKADSFASIVYPEAKIISKDEPLSNDEEAKVLEELSVNGESMDFNIYEKLIYGNNRKDIPRLSNYKIGYQITESYIENNPDMSILEWTKKGAKEIVVGSKYSALLP